MHPGSVNPSEIGCVPSIVGSDALLQQLTIRGVSASLGIVLTTSGWLPARRRIGLNGGVRLQLATLICPTVILCAPFAVMARRQWSTGSVSVALPCRLQL